MVRSSRSKRAATPEPRMPFVIAVVVLIVVLLFSAINVLNEYERAVVFTLGRFTGIKGPGLVLIFPAVQRMRKVDLRVIVLSVPKQDVITRDNVSVKVNAVVYFRIVDPGKAIIQGANACEPTSQGARIHVATVEIKDVDLDETMIRAMAKQAEAERTRRAKIINAQGERQAADTLVEGAAPAAAHATHLQLHYPR